MKTFIPLLAIVFLALVSCEEDCKLCYIKVTDLETNESELQKDTESEFCEAALEEKENAEPVNNDGRVSEWICE